MFSYNNCLIMGDVYQPYREEEINELKDSECINPLSFRRLIATIDSLKLTKNIKYIENSLCALGIPLKDSNNNYRDFSKIIDDLIYIWNEKNTNSIQVALQKTLNKQVKITYIPLNLYEKSIKDIKRVTIGTIENMSQSSIYILNDHDCFEIFQLKQIVEMVEV